MTGFAGLIKQRRRWLNGTFFAMIYTLSNWARIWTESHHRWAPRAGAGGPAGKGRSPVWLRWGCVTTEQTASPRLLSPCPPASFVRKCVLSLEFVYLMIMTFAGTWFGIGVFYTILYQLFMALFNGSTLLQNVRRCRAASALTLGGSAAAGRPHARQAAHPAP